MRSKLSPQLPAATSNLSPNLKANEKIISNLLRQRSKSSSYSQGKVPAACAKSSAVWRDLQARNLILMAIQESDSLTSQRIPNVDRVVIVAGEEQSARDREVDRVHAEDYAFFAVDSDFFVCSQIKQATRGVIRACRDGIATRVEFHTIYVRLMTLKRLHDVARSHVPNECHFVATLQKMIHLNSFDRTSVVTHARDKRVSSLVWSQIDCHNIAGVAVETL